ncbi:family 5 glycoside hydrolase [Melampsora larici-populina 98AG31]|uniref:Family 5 glycoside hydrolase n=1 Tax=Melampsora larici-populina (strain 98AG31 / pathotype 3-4-7) TaxID=747676 RepID=F4RKK0_MELLP|nr:family 5 glycoside hydrolase [Melampsora larici-populina 98AG31]EGG07107.1 family 5 glycoside hydrolase [Melampsora larici-populina 98AG31]
MMTFRYLPVLLIVQCVAGHPPYPPRETRATLHLDSHNYSTEQRGYSKNAFVTAKGDGHLYLDDRLFDFRGFNAPTLLEVPLTQPTIHTLSVGGDWQARDLLETISGFGTPATRTYPLRIANTQFGGYIPPSSGQVIGWDQDRDGTDWIYNETKWEQIDRVLQMSYRHGVKLIIPIINQDYGSSSTNYIGNFNDLIRHRYNITDYDTARNSVDWFTDPEMLRVFKKLLSKFLNRINTVNHIRYGNDNTILAIETGNEMNWRSQNHTSFRRSPPAKLVDARNIDHPWEEEVLKSPDVDILSYHLYGDDNIDYFHGLNEQVRRYNKTLILGEHGFYSETSLYKKAYDLYHCAGTLIWSLTAHSEKGGFVTHSEGNAIFSYHIPGWATQTASDFDTQEHEVVHSTYRASYTALGLYPPPFPIPGSPHAFFVHRGAHVGISWMGVAWAYSYQIFGAHVRNLAFNLVAQTVHDNVAAGDLFLPIDPTKPTQAIVVKVLPAQPQRSHAGWKDDKWNHGSTHKSTHKTQTTSNDIQKLILSPNQPRALEGGWWMVRGISVDGIPGPFSKPIFLSPFSKSNP